MRTLGKIFCFGFFAAAGIALGIGVFSVLDVVTVEGSTMMPQLEPGDRLLVLRRSAMGEIQTGDLVVYEAPYYTTDGEGLEKVRRVTGSRGSWLRLNCDVKTVTNQEVLVSRDEILGKVVFHLSRMRRPGT